MEAERALKQPEGFHAARSSYGHSPRDVGSCTFNGNSGGPELLPLKDGVIAPIFVRNTDYLRARVDECPALHSIDLYLLLIPWDH